MFAEFRRLIGSVSVKESNGVITISGLPADTLNRDIAKQWSTSRITNNMLISFSRSQIRLHSFFALDFEYMLRTMIANKTITTNKRALKTVLAELHENTWLKDIAKSPEELQKPLDVSKLSELNVDLLQHQKQFINYYNVTKMRYNLKGMLLAAAPGGGKTIASLAVSVCAKAEKVIIISPKNAVHRVWQAEINKRIHQQPQRPWVAADRMPFTDHTRWYVFHYEALDQALQYCRAFSGKKVVVVLDESHNFNDGGSLRTQRFVDLCNMLKPTDVIWSSGTPIKAMGAESIPLLRTIDPMFTTEVESRFKKIYGKDAEKAHDIIRNRLGIVVYKVPKATFMSEKPVEQTLKVKVPGGEKYTLENLKGVMRQFIDERSAFYKSGMKRYRARYDTILDGFEAKLTTPEQKADYKRYRNYVDTFVKHGFDPVSMKDMAMFCNGYEKNTIGPTLPNDVRKEFRDIKSIIKYVDLKVRGECLGRILAKERMQCISDMVAHVDFSNIIGNAEKKTIVFTSYVKVVDVVEKRLKDENFKPVKVYGDTNSDLANIVAQFDKNPELNPLIATFQSLSTAVPLTMANTLIMMNSPFRHHELDQAISRCFRIGQDATVRYYMVTLDTGDQPNISTRTEEIMQWSKEQVNQIMGIEGTDMGDISLEAFYMDQPERDLRLDQMYEMLSVEDIDTYLENWTCGDPVIAHTAASILW